MAAVADKKLDQKIIVPDAVAAQPRHLPVVSADASAMMQIIDRAARDPNFDPAKLAQLLDVKERWDREEARKAFIAAMALFKAEVPQILKSKGVSIPGGAVFKHAELATVCDAVVPALSKHGFAHRWEVNQAERLITVACLLTHERGHETRTTLQGYPDDSGKKNPIQQVGSTVTYLERYTLMAATGLAAKGMDNDGRGAGVGSGRADDMKDDDREAYDKKIVDYLAWIEESADAESVKKTFAHAWNFAEEVKDKATQKRLMEARDKRLSALRKGGRS